MNKLKNLILSNRKSAILIALSLDLLLVISLAVAISSWATPKLELAKTVTLSDTEPTPLACLYMPAENTLKCSSFFEVVNRLFGGILENIR